MNQTLHQCRSQRGFTLVELFIVISLMTIMAGLVIPSFMPDLTQRLESGADVVAADLAWSRSLAVTNNSSYRITFNTTTSEYSLQHSGTNTALDTLPPSAFGRFTDPSNRVTTRLSDLPVLGASIRLYTVMKRTTAGNETSVTTLEFGPFGETTRPESTIIWLTAGTGDTQRFIPLTVDPVTGLATVGSMTNLAPGSLAGSTTPESNN